MYAAETSWARPKIRVTRAGVERAKKFSSHTITRNAPAKPKIGENNSPWNVFSSPLKVMFPQPPAATPAPAMLKMSAWLELDGRPKYQVAKFQTMADSSA